MTRVVAFQCSFCRRIGKATYYGFWVCLSCKKTLDKLEGIKLRTLCQAHLAKAKGNSL